MHDGPECRTTEADCPLPVPEDPPGPKVPPPSRSSRSQGATTAQPISRPVEADASPSNDYVEKEGQDVLEQEDDNEYPRGFKLAALTSALMLATFMVALDTNIIGEQTLGCFYTSTLSYTWT